MIVGPKHPDTGNIRASKDDGKSSQVGWLPLLVESAIPH